MQDSTTTAVFVPERDAVVQKFVVRAQRNVGGSSQFETIDWPTPAKAGDQLDIWINENGEKVAPPFAPNNARDAVMVAVLSWLVLVGLAAGGLYLRGRRPAFPSTVSMASPDSSYPTNGPGSLTVSTVTAD